MESKGATVESQKMCGKTPMFHGQTGFPVDVPLKQPSDLCMSYIYIVSKKAVKNYLTTILEWNFTKACIVLVVATYILGKRESLLLTTPRVSSSNPAFTNTM